MESRTILLFGEINMDVARDITKQLLVLDAESDEPIKMIHQLARRPCGIGRHDL